MPMMKPSSAKLRQVRTRKVTIQSGCAMTRSTKKNDVARMISPIISALVAAAST
jgi:hypothetical protein